MDLPKFCELFFRKWEVLNSVESRGTIGDTKRGEGGLIKVTLIFILGDLKPF